MPQMRVVYDLSGDEPKPLERFTVDADELVRSDPDRYSFEADARAGKAKDPKAGKK